MTFRFLLITLLLVAAPVHAQGDLDSERRSLQGVTSLYVDVVVEGPGHLVESDVLGLPGLAQRVEEQLHAAGLPVRPGNEHPRLHIHVNMIEVQGGLIPFAVNAAFYQEVRLAGTAFQMAAPTWTEGAVGLVSRDMLALVAEHVEAVAEQFAHDFKVVNP